MTASHVGDARVKTMRMPATASHAGSPAPNGTPSRRATSTTTTTDIRLATSEVSTCAHSTDDRAIGRDCESLEHAALHVQKEPEGRVRRRPTRP